jgi:hypothetical protein
VICAGRSTRPVSQACGLLLAGGCHCRYIGRPRGKVRNAVLPNDATIGPRGSEVVTLRALGDGTVHDFRIVGVDKTLASKLLYFG